jgi:ABC-2 type transport system ATP-binding protein
VLRTVALHDLHAGHTSVELRVDAATPGLLTALQTVSTNGVTVLNSVAGAQQCLQLTLADEELLPAVAERVLASGARLYALTPQRITLEQLFLEVVGTEDSGQ